MTVPYRMKLVDLEPEFLKREDDNHFRMVDSISDADGVTFVCPQCMSANQMKRPGVHSVICWAPSVPQTTSPRPGRWNIFGSGFADLSLVAGSSSVALTGPGCGAHFMVQNGEVYSC